MTIVRAKEAQKPPEKMNWRHCSIRIREIAKRAYFSIRSYPSSHFQAIEWVRNDSKSRTLGSSCLEAKRRQASFIHLWRTASSAKVMGFWCHLYGWWRVDSLLQNKKTKARGLPGQASTSLARPKIFLYKGFVVNLFEPGQWYLLWAVEIERNHQLGILSNSVDVLEPKNAQKVATIHADARKRDSTAWQRPAWHCQTH